MEMESALERAATCPILVGRKHHMEIVRTGLENAASELARLLPEMAARLPQPQLASSTPALALRAPLAGGPQGDSSPAAHYRLISTLTTLFAQLASIQPLMIVLEDLHWSDDVSLEF